MPNKPDTEYTPDEFLEMVKKLFGEKGAHFFSQRDAQAMQAMMDKYHALKDEDKEAVAELFQKAKTLGRIVETFENIDGFIRTAKYLKNMAWLFVAITVFALWSQGKLSSVFDAIKNIGSGGPQ